MTIYIHGTDSVLKWFGHRMKKNLINKWATGLSGFLCVGGFVCLILSKRRGLPRECIFSSLGIGLFGLSWSALIAVVRRGYKPLPKVYFDDDILMDIEGDEVLVSIDSDTAIDKLVEILSQQEDILADVRRTLWNKKRDLKNLIELLETGESSEAKEPTTTLYYRMFIDMSKVFYNNELDVQVAADYSNCVPDTDFSTRTQQSLNFLKKVENVFLHYMYVVESLFYGCRPKPPPEIVRADITRKRKLDAIKMMMTYKIPKRVLYDNVELVQYIGETIPRKLREFERRK